MALDPRFSYGETEVSAPVNEIEETGKYSARDILSALAIGAAKAGSIEENKPIAAQAERAAAPGGGQVSIPYIAVGEKMYVKDQSTGGYRKIKDPQQLALLGLQPEQFFKIDLGELDPFTRNLGYVPQFGPDLTEEEILTLLTGKGNLGRPETAGLPTASVQDMLRALPDDKLLQFIKFTTDQRIRPDLDQLARQEEGSRFQLKQAQAATPGVSVAPGKTEEFGALPKAEVEKPQPTSEITEAPIAKATEQIERLGALAPPSIEEFKFNVSEKPREIAEGQFQALKSRAEQEINKSRIVGLEDLSLRGRLHGGQQALLQAELGGKLGELVGQAKLEAAETERKATAGERSQRFGEYIAKVEPMLKEFDSKAQARISSIDAYLADAKGAAELNQAKYENFLVSTDNVLQSAYASKSMEIKKLIEEGKLSVDQGQNELKQIAVNMERIQNDLKEKLNPAALKAIKTEARAQYISGVLSTTLGAAAVGAAIGGAPGAVIGGALGLTGSLVAKYL